MMKFKIRRLFCSFLSMILLLTSILFTSPLSVLAVAKDASFVRTEIPDEMLAGHIYPVKLTVKNTGTDTYTYSENYRLGALSSNNLKWCFGKFGNYYGGHNNQRIYLADYDVVEAGNGASFVFSVEAPTTAGNYTFGAQMVQDGVTWFGSTYSKTIIVKNIVADGLPKKLKANSTYRVTVSVLNKGENTWTRAGNFELKRVDTNFTWSNWRNGGTSNSAYLEDSDSIATNEGTSFSFDLTTPANPGNYNFSAQVKVGDTSYSDLYSRNFEVVSDCQVYLKEGESFLDVSAGTKYTDSASGGAYSFTQGSGNTPMWKTPSDYTSYVDTAGEYNIWMRTLCTKTVPLRIQMYGGPSDGAYVDCVPTDINAWQWIGPLKVNFQAGYNNYQLTLWKLGGDSTDFAGVDKIYLVSTDVDNAFARKLNIDDVTMNYIIPHTTSGINVNANDNIPVFYKMTGTRDSVIQLNQEKNHENFVTLRDTMNPGIIRVKVEYLGQPAAGYAKFKFTNLADYGGKATDTILKSHGYGRIVFDHGNFFNPIMLDDDLLPGQSVDKTFKASWLTDSNGDYIVKVCMRKHDTETIGTFTVDPGNVGASTVISSTQSKTKLEAETALTVRSGTGIDTFASNGSYGYASGAGNAAIHADYRNYDYYVDSSGTYFVWARVRENNHAATVRMQMYCSDNTNVFIDAHTIKCDNEWEWIGPLKVDFDPSKTYNLAFWRMSGETNDRLEVDEVEFVKYDYWGNLSSERPYPVIGAEDAYNRKYGFQDEWKMIEVPQPPKSTSLYVKLMDSRQQVANKEVLNVALGSNLTSTMGNTVYDWTIDGGKRVFAAWYYPYREKDIEPDWQTKVTTDLQNIVANGYNVVLLQLFPQFVFGGSPINYALTECRRLGIKILPSIYYVNQHQWLEQKTGINFRTADADACMADATDPEFSRALATWYDMLYADWGDVFYVNANGQTPILYGEEHGYGFTQGWPWGSRKGPNNIENMRAFRDWLWNKYGTNNAWNAAWGYGSSYPTFDSSDTIPNMLLSEIVTNQNTSVINKSPQNYTDKWKEGRTAIADFDAFRSSSLKDGWLGVQSRILVNHPNTLFGMYTLGQYGLEDILGSYYNYTETRPGVFGDDLAQYTDFVVTFYYTVKEVESSTNYWQGKGNDLVAFVRECGGTAEIFDTSPQKLSDGAYSDIAGLYGVCYDINIPLYPILKEAYKMGAIPGVYSWDDYPLWNVTGASMREDIGIYRDNIINNP